MKQFKHFEENYGFQSDKKQAWGDYKGYQFAIGRYENNNNILTVFTALNFEDSSHEEKLNSILEGMVAKKEIQNYEINRGSLTIKKTKLFGRFPIKELESLLDNLVDVFQKIDAKPACFICNSEGKQKFARYNNIATTLCPICYTSISDNINEVMVEYQDIDNNYAFGTLGAILGALLGSIIWVIISLLGYIASFAGFAIIVASVKGYLLFKGKITSVSLWIIGLTSLTALILAQFVTLDIVFYRELTNAGFDIPIFDVLRATFELPFTDPEITSAFIFDTILGLLFAGLGAYSTFRKLWEEVKSPVGNLEWL
ncbi:hypothetical protein SAMN05446037_1001169 [Anaerovirgula multivorans]|uniref:Uncharacterized protein n=1 Tax=Anaerovirgula multivorans TaxID=312168 RepID=A0A238ZW03_9FIRM|nr:hypothetical protein [Anaerovirgula multivorans]SNR87545.1 hypothetical protein SAMN05446037_1001169 [Anaerovirgula multivorans]